MIHEDEIVSLDVTGGRGGITQGVSFEFFESFLLIYSPLWSKLTHWAILEIDQKKLFTLPSG